MIDYRAELNPAQLEAVNSLEGAVLVIAGAGSGKTRTIVYRLARLVESGVPASSILLLTFTRKAAREMLERAGRLLGRQEECGGEAWVQGGTFHSFAYLVLRLFQPEGYGRAATVLDADDALGLLQICREDLRLGKGDRSFPQDRAVLAILSKSRNREQPLEEVLRRDFAHLLPHADNLAMLEKAYAVMKRERALLDYDDLLFELETLLRRRPEALNWCRRRYRYLMVDEFQDTNLVQARLAALLAGGEAGPPGTEPGGGNIMAVGDDAQSIYAFRGANVRNILDFTGVWPQARLIRLEENYRSVQPVLDLCNTVLDNAKSAYRKHLFTRRTGGALPQVLRPLSDLSQGEMAAAKVAELLRLYPPGEIAVLFRAGYQSYHTEARLNRLGITFRKYGGQRYTEAAHVRDVLAFVRLLLNPLDFAAFRRVTAFIRGIGGKTAFKLHQALQAGESAVLEKACLRYPELGAQLEFLDGLRLNPGPPALILRAILDHYQPILEQLYPDDYPRRLLGLEELAGIALNYEDLDLFAADLSLSEPDESVDNRPLSGDRREQVTLSTIHSAKGLEWEAVLVLDLVEERFPSRQALLREEDFEEERRLMYVACTRAKSYLGLFVPASLHDRRSGGRLPALPSPFVRELPPTLYEEWREGFLGLASPRPRSAVETCDYERSGPEMPGYEALAPLDASADVFADRPAAAALTPASSLGYCTHKLFGRGKLVRFMPPDKYQVHFPGFGLKVILAAYLSVEDKA